MCRICLPYNYFDVLDVLKKHLKDKHYIDDFSMDMIALYETIPGSGKQISLCEDPTVGLFMKMITSSVAEGLCLTHLFSCFHYFLRKNRYQGWCFICSCFGKPIVYTTNPCQFISRYRSSKEEESA